MFLVIAHIYHESLRVVPHTFTQGSRLTTFLNLCHPNTWLPFLGKGSEVGSLSHPVSEIQKCFALETHGHYCDSGPEPGHALQSHLTAWKSMSVYGRHHLPLLYWINYLYDINPEC